LKRYAQRQKLGLRASEKNNYLSCLSFGPPAVLKKDLHTTSMRTFFNPAGEPKSGAIWIIIFFRGPKHRNSVQIGVDWQFTNKKIPTKLKRLYQNLS
jgi:hypothetical protein